MTRFASPPTAAESFDEISQGKVNAGLNAAEQEHPRRQHIRAAAAHSGVKQQRHHRRPKIASSRPVIPQGNGNHQQEKCAAKQEALPKIAMRRAAPQQKQCDNGVHTGKAVSAEDRE